MSKRVLVLVDRSMTDKTSKIIWEHEIPILKEVHSCDVRVTDPETLDKMPMDHYGIGESFKTRSEDDEWNRLANVYGLHPKIEILFVERVYGSQAEGRFSAAIGGRNAIAKDEFDMRDTSSMLIESVELGLWNPGIKRELWPYDMIMKAARNKGVWKKDTSLRESVIAMLRKNVESEERMEMQPS